MRTLHTRRRAPCRVRMGAAWPRVGGTLDPSLEQAGSLDSTTRPPSPLAAASLMKQSVKGPAAAPTGPWAPLGHIGLHWAWRRDSPCRLFASGLPAPPAPVIAEPSRQDRKKVSGLAPPGAQGTTPAVSAHPPLSGEPRHTSPPDSFCAPTGGAAARHPARALYAQLAPLPTPTLAVEPDSLGPQT